MKFAYEKPDLIPFDPRYFARGDSNSCLTPTSDEGHQDDCLDFDEPDF